MAELSPEIVAQVVEACQAGAQEAADALGRGLDIQVQLRVGEPGSLDTSTLPDGLTEPGLAVVWTVGTAGAVLLLPERSGFLPSWYGDPDPAGKGKLGTLAQELGTTLLPGEYAPNAADAAKVESLSDALTRSGASNGAAVLPLHLEQAEGPGATAYMIWPAADPAAVLEQRTADSDEQTHDPEQQVAQPEPQGAEPETTAQPPPPSSSEESAAVPSASSETPWTRPSGVVVGDLPPHARSLLRIKLPVVVTLARQRQPICRIVKLGPGSIIQFEKSCEEMLEMEVGGHSIATGEAVKVGDKFGLRVNSMILPDERFTPVRKR